MAGSLHSSDSEGNIMRLATLIAKAELDLPKHNRMRRQLQVLSLRQVRNGYL